MLDSWLKTTTVQSLTFSPPSSLHEIRISALTNEKPARSHFLLSLQTCVKMTYYVRDKYDTIAMQTHFCGKGVMMSDEGRVRNRDDSWPDE